MVDYKRNLRIFGRVGVSEIVHCINFA